MQNAKKQVQEAKGAVAEQKPTTVKVFEGGIYHLAFSPDSQFVVTGPKDGTVRIWDRHGVLVRSIKLPSGSVALPVSSKTNTGNVAVSHNGQFIVSSNNKGVYEWDFQSGALRQTYNVSDLSFVVAISPDDQSIVSTGFLGNHGVCIWDRSDGYNFRKRVLAWKTGRFGSVAISPNGQYIVSSCYSDNTVHIWAFATGRLLKALQGHSDRINCVAISKDNQTIVSASDDKSVRVWDLDTGTQLKILEGHSGGVGSVAITPDGQYIVSASDDKTVRIWNLKTGECLSAVTQQLSASAWTVAISPDGTQIAAGDNSGNLHIWDFPPAVKAAKSWVLSTFMEVLANPRKLTVALLQEMLTKVNHIDEFRFAYTLINIQLQQVPAHKNPLYSDIYKCLERLSETCLIGPSKDSKESSRQGANYIARYKGILKALCRACIITEHEQDMLDNLAERNMVFSDHRFKELEGQVHALKYQVELQQENLELIAQDLNQLKKSLKAKAEREMYFGIAKVATLFLVNGVVDLLASALNMSDVAEMGATLLKMEVKEWKGLVKKGAGVVKEHLTESGAEFALKKAGFDPDALVDIWVSSTVHLQATPVSSSISSSITISSSLSHSTSALESSSSTTTSPPQRRESKRPDNVAQSFSTVKSPIMSPTAGGRRGSESDLYPLHSAIKKNSSTETIGDLLDVGEDINGKNTDGKTPVQIAAERGNVDMVKFLLGRGAAGNKLHLLKQARELQSIPVAQPMAHK